MSMPDRTLDQILKDKNVHVEPEILLEPETEPEDARPSFKQRLKRYGNRVLNSAERFILALRRAIVGVVTAVGNTFILLLTIVARGGFVLLRGVLTSVKEVVLSVARTVFEVLRAVFDVLSAPAEWLNNRFLKPTLKRIREDDTAAALALLVLIVLVVVVGSILHFVVKAF